MEDLSESESGKLVQAGCILPELGPVILAHEFASGQDAFAQNLTRPSRSDLDQFCAVGSKPSLEESNQTGGGNSDQAYTIRPDSGCTMAILVFETKMLLNGIQHVY